LFLHPRRIAAFTLIELLVVVGIISILASIAVPNFLEAQTRAKVSRMKNDMRVVATGLEAYAVDFGRYPPRKPFPDVPGLPLAVLGDSRVRVADLSRVTTPISFINRIPQDVFENSLAPPNNVVDYWTVAILETQKRGAGGWALVSVGPDGFMGQIGNQGMLPNPGDPIEGTLRFDYDPTNGTVSTGNVYRFQTAESATALFFR